MKKQIIILFTFAICSQLNGQIIISGKVSNARTGEVLSGASVTVHKKGSDNIIGYGICNNAGEYSARVAAQSDSLDIRAAYLGYAEQVVSVAPQSQSINFSLEEKEFVLKEVRVLAPKIRGYGDTISYNAAQFTKESDRVLTDILDRMPGVEVNKETGGIKYQGKNINRFYVENQNLMDGRYGEVSKNLPADAVKTVEVFENHQPVRALQDISFSDQAAMNIKLTDKAKGKWIGNGFTAGLGMSPLLWRAEFSAMRFSPKYQTYFTYKSNNTGQDIKIYNQFIMIMLLGADETNTNAFYSPFLSSPSLNPQRSLFNRSHVVSVNNLWKTGKDSNIRFNIDYRNEEKQQASSQTTKYYITADSVFTYSEKYKVNSYENKLEGNLTYTNNSPKLFLENKLSFETDWQKINSHINAGDSVNQYLHLPSFEISDNFKIIARTAKKRTYNFSSSNKFRIMPQQLSGNRALSASNFVQAADVKTFESSNRVSFGHNIKRVNISYNASYDLSSDNYDTGSKKYNRNEHNLSFTPSLVHKSGSFTTNINLPIQYINISGTDSNDKFSGIVFEPRLSIRYAISYFLELSLNGNLSSKFGSIYDLVSGVMKDYRTQYVFNGDFPRRNIATTGLQLNYKNPIKALYAYMNLSYSHTTSRNTSEQIVSGAQIINNITKGKNTSQGISAMGYLSKIFDWRRSVAKLNWNVSSYKSERLRNSVIVPLSTFSFSLNPSFEIETFSHQMLTYAIAFSASRSEIQNTKQPFMHNVKQNFTYYIPLTRKLNITLVGEHLRNQISAAQYVNMFLADASVRYKISPKTEFSLNWNNIFDTREYSYSYYNDLYYTSYSYQLRPMNIIFTANIRFR